MKELLEKIAKAMVDSPDEVKVTEIEGEHTVVLELNVAKNDIGKIVGKEGNHAKAIRTILLAASGKRGKRYSLEIIG